MALIWNGLFLTYFSSFLPGKTQTKKILQYISHLHTNIHVHVRILLTLMFFAFSVCKKMRIYHVWFLFDVTRGFDSFSRHFGAIDK